MKTYFLTTMLLVISTFITAQNTAPDSNIYTKSVQLIKGLPPGEFYDKFRKDERLYSFAELKDTLQYVSTTLLIRQKANESFSFYLIFRENFEALKVESLAPIRNENGFSFTQLNIPWKNSDFTLSINYSLNGIVSYNYYRKAGFKLNSSFEISPAMEGVFILKNYKASSYNFNHYSSNSDYNKISMNILFALALRIKFAYYHSLELRPAIAGYEKPFQGLELGLFYRTYWREDVFTFLGTAFHLGLEGSHGGFDYHEGSGGFLYGLGFGFGISDRMALTFGTYSVQSINSYEILHTTQYDYSNPSNHLITGTTTEKKWNWLFNIGIEYNY